jgi:hypothetical protein
VAAVIMRNDRESTVVADLRKSIEAGCIFAQPMKYLNYRPRRLAGLR